MPIRKSQEASSATGSSMESGHVVRSTATTSDTHDPVLTPFEKVQRSIQINERWHKDIAVGKRVGFYRLKDELGTGNFSQVKLGIHTLTQEKVAVKIVDKMKLDDKSQKMLTREIANMERLAHPHLIQLFEVAETAGKVYLILEYAAGGELFARVSEKGRFSENDSRRIFFQVASAINYMHSRKILHRDIKAENVFFASLDVVKVGDFGFSTTVAKPSFDPLTTFCGSPPYAAPELFQDESYIGASADVWALGVLLYFTVVGNMPFKAQTVSALKKMIIESGFETPQFVSAQCSALLAAILKKRPLERLTLCQILASDWLKSEQIIFPNGNNYTPDNEVVQGQLVSSFCDGFEADVSRELRLLGISDTVLKEHLARGRHTPVTGTYRIVKNIVYKKKSILCADDKIARPAAAPNAAKQKIIIIKKSKACSIL